MKVIAITPVHNEEDVIVSVLDRIKRHVDILIVSNDGSTDASSNLIAKWRRSKTGVYVIEAPRNVGASAALKKGYALVAHLVRQGTLDPDDAVVEIDSDGQHDPDDIPRLVKRFIDSNRRAVVLAQRDFSNYPAVKIWGNRFLTTIASILAGTRYRDVESNYRVVAARVLPELLPYFWGYRYSGAFEVGIILGRLGYHIDNDCRVRVPYYRSGSRAGDGFHVLAAGLLAWIRVMRRRPYASGDEVLRIALAELVANPPEFVDSAAEGRA